jgi:hypothetical protein
MSRQCPAITIEVTVPDLLKHLVVASDIYTVYIQLLHSTICIEIVTLSPLFCSCKQELHVFLSSCIWFQLYL